MNNNICLVYNYAQHYRTNIFTLMDKELPIDFVFGDKYLDVKKMDYKLLKNFKKEVKNVVFINSPFSYQTGVIQLLFEHYSKYLFLGDLNCISTWISLFLGKLLKKDIYLWSHGWYGKEGRLKTIIKKVFFNLAKGTFLYGDYAKNLMIEAGIKSKKLFVIHNSLMYDEHLIFRNTSLKSDVYYQRFNNYNRVLLFVGRLTKEKRLDILLESINKMNSENEMFNLVIIGTGEEELNLKNKTQEMELTGSTWFYGACYDEEILAKLIYNADLCISPGNVGLTAIHSLSFGTPVITHNRFELQMPEFESIIPEVTGNFFEYNNLDSLINVIISWFKNKRDREEIRLACHNIIDSKWNPYFQLEVFKKYLLI